MKYNTILKTSFTKQDFECFGGGKIFEKAKALGNFKDTLTEEYY
jgi:hypothetical protein